MAEKKGRGRPVKESKASAVLPPIRVTVEQKRLYKEAADQEGVSLSTWIKNIADKAIKKAHG